MGCCGDNAASQSCYKATRECHLKMPTIGGLFGCEHLNVCRQHGGTHKFVPIYILLSMLGKMYEACVILHYFLCLDVLCRHLQVYLI